MKAYQIRHMEQDGMAMRYSKQLFPVLGLGLVLVFLGCDSGGAVGIVNGTVNDG